MQIEDNGPILITTQRYLSDALEKEVQALGYEVQGKFLTGISTQGTMRDSIRLNLRLRTASHVMKYLEGFDCHSLDDVYEYCSKMPWEHILDPTEEFSVTSNVFHRSINNNMIVNLRVKDAIVDRIRARKGMRPNSSSDMSGAVVYIFWKGNKAQIYLDTSGRSIARHGYRRVPGTAPMLESLAAACLYTTRWDAESSMVNPMCGSGTVAIEAALMMKKAPPSEFREHFAFMALPSFDQQYYREEKQKIRSEILSQPIAPILASDISARAIKNAKINAEAAGVSDWIRFETEPFERTAVPQSQKGIIFFNPEYGERLGDKRELERTYGEIGDYLKQNGAGYWGYIFTGDLDLAKKVGLRPKRKIPFYNSKIECRLLEYEMYEGSKKAKFQKEP